jgi:hypothetical protein
MNTYTALHPPNRRYHSYLVRLWQDGPHAAWRASLHCVQTHESLHFADLEQLFAFLAMQTALIGPPAHPLAEPPVNPADKGAADL